MSNNKYTRGSEWRKWDLHIHTPVSLVNHFQGQSIDEKWENFIADLENLPSEFKVIGINDYLFIDGYERVLTEKKKGRLKNIETIFPVIEFRIKKFAGNKVFKRVNYHIIFSEKLDINIIKQQFLNQLYGKYKLAPGNDGIEWGGFITPDSLRDLGKAIKSTVPPEKLHEYGSDIEEGFNNINFDEEEIVNILNNSKSYLKDKFLTAIGKTEWDSFAWDDNSIAEKKTVINKADFVFISSENIEAFNKAKDKLIDQKVNSLLFDCSDAHRNSNSIDKDRIGKCFTWIKADTTFEGLKQVLNEPDRIYVGGKPELLQRLTTNPNKFIKDVSIKRIDNTSMQEIWYDDLKIPLNSSLVAVIGNKGNGKSALADIIGLVGGSHNENYSFLTKKKFRNPKPYNKASHIEGLLTWMDGSTDGYTRLDSSVDMNKSEKVKYIPQHFLETLCTDEDDYNFENEIKKIIFSHTDVSDRLGFSNLDELITYKSEIINKELGVIKGELDDLNQRIINLERKNQINFKLALKQKLEDKQKELDNHKLLKPVAMPEPKTDPAIEERNKGINEEISLTKESYQKKRERISEINATVADLLIKEAELEKAKQAFKSLENSILTIANNQTDILSKYDLNVQDVFVYSLKIEVIDGVLNPIKDQLKSLNIELKGDGGQVNGLDADLLILKGKLERLDEKLDEPYRIYQKYLKDLSDWNMREKALIGDKTKIDTIENLRDQIKYVEERLTAEIQEEVNKRNLVVTKLFLKKSEINTLYSNSYKPITDFISKYGHLMKDYQINLSVDFTLDGFLHKFFDHVSQGAKGTYIGIEEGNKYLNELISQHTFNFSEGIIKFLDDIRNTLFFDKRQDQANADRELDSQLKKGYTREDFYRFLYSLEYLKPTFKLNLGNKELSELSPGERGALLLIFYLFLDKDDKPLIIDQPEENLDNQSVYHYLVHFIKEAKQKRQIIIVTHNPNLAVVCDAEQVIHMNIDKSNNNTVSFISGAIENPTINKTIVDILEGTKPALNNRTSKYALAY